MSLETFVKQEIKDRLNAQKTEYDTKLSELDRELSRQVTTVERTYTSEVERAIEAQVNLEAFQGKKSADFTSAQSLNDQIEKLYEDSLPEIMSSSFGVQELNKFLSKATSKTEFTLTGTHAKLLADQLAVHKMTNITTSQSSDLGSITYTSDDTVIEFTLNDLISEAKDRTISKVIACI